jgi:hypothetical protein
MATKMTDPNRELRNEQLAQIGESISVLERRLYECMHNQRDQLTLLDSVSRGLYDEIDKLAKKAPAEPITDLALGQINDVIRETKQLVTSDPYVQRLSEFVPAGDNPQHRDAVIVLRQIRQGLERFGKQLDSLIDLLRFRLRDAQGIHVAIQLSLEGHTEVTREELKEYGVDVSSDWIYGYPEMVNFTRLDRIKISNYFAEAQLL